MNMRAPDGKPILAAVHQIIFLCITQMLPAAVGKVKAASLGVPLPDTIVGRLNDARLTSLTFAQCRLDVFQFRNIEGDTGNVQSTTVFVANGIGAHLGPNVFAGFGKNPISGIELFAAAQVLPHGFQRASCREREEKAEDGGSANKQSGKRRDTHEHETRTETERHKTN